MAVPTRAGRDRSVQSPIKPELSVIVARQAKLTVEVKMAFYILAPSSLAQWFAAVGTILAVIVALFKDWIRATWNRPLLNAVCENRSPWTIKTRVHVLSSSQQILWEGDCYWVRIEVKNSGKSRAEKVQVYASRLEKLSLDDKFEEIESFIPLNMKWSNSPPNAPVITLDGISPTMSAFCDAVSLSDPANPTETVRPPGAKDGETLGYLQLEVAPNSGSHILAKGKYMVTLLIAAANVTPIKKTLIFKHTGAWTFDEDTMRRDYLTVSLL
jgi:hypothetical protein